MGSSDLTKWKIHIMFYFVSDYGVGMHKTNWIHVELTNVLLYEQWRITWGDFHRL